MEQKLTLFHGSEKVIEHPAFGTEKNIKISVWAFTARRACIRFPGFWAARWRSCRENKNADFYPTGADGSPCFL